MSALLLLPLIFVFQPLRQDPSAAEQRSSVVVLNFKWFKDHQAAENAVAPPGPQPGMIAANRNFEYVEAFKQG